jgi:uncharacterized protein with beta-barrel porin domain
VPLFAALLPASASDNQRAVANALDAFTANGGVLPLAFANLLTLSPSDLANALTQLSGEAGSAVPQAGTQAMNSFLSLVTNPFAENRSFAPERPRSPLIVKAPVYKASVGVAPDPRPWEIWGAAYGGQNNTSGDVFVGSHDRSSRTWGFATGLDYRVAPYTVLGFALGGGGTNFGLSDGLGGGHSDNLPGRYLQLDPRQRGLCVGGARVRLGARVDRAKSDHTGHRPPHRRLLRQ